MSVRLPAPKIYFFAAQDIYPSGYSYGYRINIRSYPGQLFVGRRFVLPEPICTSAHDGRVSAAV